MKEIFNKLISCSEPMVLAKALCLIVCIGDAFQYDVSKTHVFFENSLMSIYKANQSL